MPSRLERSTTNKVIAGVCGGIAEYLELDATLVRAFFVFAGIITAGLAILGYIVLLVLMPLPGRPAPFTTQAGTSTTTAEPTAEGAEPTAPRPVVPPDPAQAERRRAAFGYFLIALGVIFLLGNVGAFRIVRWDFIWPLVLVGVGVLLLAQRVRR